MENKLEKALNEMVKERGIDYSFIEAQAHGKELTEQQRRAKESVMELINEMEKPEIDERVSAILNS